MLGTLIKKQLREMLLMLVAGGKKGKKRSKASIVMYTLLMLYAAGAMFFLFFITMQFVCEPLVSVGLGWLYFALAGMMAIVLAIIGSVFMTQSILYEAKDNEFLLSMPIPPAKILLSRMISLYLQNLLFGGLIFIPAVVVYAMTVEIGTASMIAWAALILLLPLLSLASTCILAWLTVLLTSRMRNKTIFTMVLSLGFLGAYFYFYSQINQYLQLLLTNGAAIGEKIRKILYPVYQLGLAAEGGLKALALFTIMVVVLFGLVYFVLGRSFIQIATTKRGVIKTKYEKTEMRVNSIGKALLGREARRFVGSAIYMLNCGLGTIVMAIGVAALLIKKEELLMIAGQLPGAEAALPLIGCVAICLLAATNIVTAPSISLEGKTLWLLQSLPLDGKQILKAKIKLHLWVTAPMAVVCSLVVCALLRPSLEMTILLTVIPFVFILLCGEIGLLYNLKLPNLNWVNETAAVKQSLSAILSMFSNWGILAGMTALYFCIPSESGLSTEVFLAVTTGVIGIGAALLWRVLMTWGAKQIEYLS